MKDKHTLCCQSQCRAQDATDVLRVRRERERVVGSMLWSAGHLVLICITWIRRTELYLRRSGFYGGTLNIFELPCIFYSFLFIIHFMSLFGTKIGSYSLDPLLQLRYGLRRGEPSQAAPWHNARLTRKHQCVGRNTIHPAIASACVAPGAQWDKNNVPVGETLPITQMTIVHRPISLPVDLNQEL